MSNPFENNIFKIVLLRPGGEEQRRARRIDGTWCDAETGEVIEAGTSALVVCETLESEQQDIDREISELVTTPIMTLPGFVELGGGRMFPTDVTVGDVSIRLNADGSWTGDRKAFFEALDNQREVFDGFTMPMLWLIANALRREEVSNGSGADTTRS